MVLKFDTLDWLALKLKAGFVPFLIDLWNASAVLAVYKFWS